MVEDTKQFGESNTLQRVLKEIHCFPWFIVSLTLLYGIFLKNIVFARYLLCMVYCTDFSQSLTMAGRAMLI